MEEKNSTLKEFKNRKVPQYLGSYLAIGFALLQFIKLILIDRYQFSSNIIDVFLMFWILLIPTVVVLTYFGWEWNPILTKGKLKWPKVLVAGNFLTVLVLSFFMLNNTESLANDGEVIKVMDEKGEVIEALIPKLDKVKKVACFQFENLTGDTEQDWWGVAFSQLLQVNLEQRAEYYVNNAYGLNQFYDRMNLEIFETLSIGEQRKIALKDRNDYFTRITFRKKVNNYLFKGYLFQASSGKKVVEIEVENEDPFAAIDEIKQIIFEHIPNPLINKKSKIDLPSSTLLTDNIEALEYYTKGSMMFYKDPQALTKVKEYLDKSIKADKSCSYCYWSLGDKLYGMGKTEDAIEAFKKSIKYGKSLPMRMQINLKWVYYGFTENYKGYKKLLEMERKMFPYNFNSYEKLSEIYRVNYGIDSAKVVIKSAIDNGNKELGLIKMYELQLANQEYAAAEVSLIELMEAFPDRDQDKFKFSKLYEIQGKLDKAKEVLIEESILNPFDIGISTRIAFLEYRQVMPEKALETINRALADSSNLTDSLSLFLNKGFILRRIGQTEKALDIYNKYENEAIRKIPKNVILAKTLEDKVLSLVLNGKNEGVQSLINEIMKDYPERKTATSCNINFRILEYDLPSILGDDSFKDCIDYYKTFGKGYSEYIELMYAYANGDYQTCMNLLDGNQSLRAMINDTFIAARIYQNEGMTEKAYKIMKDAIKKKPYDPIYYYEFAKLLENNNPEEAKIYLDIALKYWDNADPDFILKQRAIELQNQLDLNS
jgi:tetratricopeptide (TPR) repeat protein